MMKKILFIVFHFSTIAAFAQLEGIKEKLKSKEKTDETVVWLCDTAFTFYSNNPYATQQVAFLALEKAKEWNSDIGKAKANHVLGISFWARDLYEESLSHYLEALKYYEGLDDSNGIASISMNVGIIYDDIKEPERGKHYQLKALEVFKSSKDTVNIARSFNNLASVYRNMGMPDSARYYFQESMKLRIAQNDSVGVARVFNNIGSLYIKEDSVVSKEDAAIAYENFVLGLKYINKGDDNNLLATLYANTGKSLIELKRWKDAESFLEESYKLAIELDSKLSQLLYYGYSKQLHMHQGNFQKAFDFYHKQVQVEREMRSAEIVEQIDELNIKYETAKKEKQLAELEKQKAVDREIRNTLLIGVVAIVIIALVLIFYSSQKRKKDKLIAQLQLEKMSEELTSKNKEIASYTMSFLQKNQLMEELKDQINELKKSSDITTNKELTRINRIVDNTFRSDEEWKTFQITFDQMHDGFFKDLKAAYPDISNAELKLCALLRLNMNLKESAKILGIAADSVKTARYRLRKKLGLKTEDNLIDFLIQFENQAKTSV